MAGRWLAAWRRIPVATDAGLIVSWLVHTAVAADTGLIMCWLAHMKVGLTKHSCSCTRMRNMACTPISARTYVPLYDKWRELERCAMPPVYATTYTYFATCVSLRVLPGPWFNHVYMLHECRISVYLKPRVRLKHWGIIVVLHGDICSFDERHH